MAMVVPKDVEFYISELNQKSPRSNYGRSWFDPNQESYKLLKYTSHDMRVQDGVTIYILITLYSYVCVLELLVGMYRTCCCYKILPSRL